MLIGADWCWEMPESDTSLSAPMSLGRPFSIYVKISQDWQKEKSSNHQKFLWILSPVFEKWFIAYITLVGFHGFGLTYK